MKIVVIGGTGLIGSQLVARVSGLGHEVIAASPKSGVNAVTGEGLAAVLMGADVVVDVANSPSFEDDAVLAFFEASSRNLLAAEAFAGVRHHVALSVVGTERMQGSGYFRAKLTQEQLIEASAIPYTIVRATQFFEFMGGIAHTSMRGDVVWLSPAAMQPMASADVAEALADAALAAPVSGMIEIAGPERAPLAEFVGTWLGETDDPRAVTVDPAAPYFGVEINDASLTPGPAARIMPTRFDDWLALHLPTRVAA
jgi:uncharacterized protein YbjT (DUF2867 family)